MGLYVLCRLSIHFLRMGEFFERKIVFSYIIVCVNTQYVSYDTQTLVSDLIMLFCVVI